MNPVTFCTKQKEDVSNGYRYNEGNVQEGL